MQNQAVAIIGAGLAGIRAAQTLDDFGFQVEIFEKSRGSGGRLSQKRLDWAHVDLGSPFYPADNPEMHFLLSEWEKKDWVKTWEAREKTIAAGGEILASRKKSVFIGKNGNQQPLKQILRQWPFHREKKIIKIDIQGDQYFLIDEDQLQSGPFSAIVLAIPATQAKTLLPDAAEIKTAIADIKMQSQWSIAMAFGESLMPDTDILHLEDSEVETAYCQDDKPGRVQNANSTVWVFHFTPRFTQETLTWDKCTMIHAAWRALSDQLRVTPPIPRESYAHLWRYSQCENQKALERLCDDDLNIALAGDWTLGGGMPAAWHSGMQAASELMTKLC